METLLALTLFGSVIGVWAAMLLFIVICFIADANESGYAATVALVILGIMLYIWSDVKAILALFSIASVVGYFLIGLGFSVFRTFFAGRKLGKEIKDKPTVSRGNQGEYDTKERARKEFLNEMQGNVFRWWFMWPISLISWVATDFIVDAWDYLYSKVSKFYNYVLDLGIKSIGV